MNLSFHKYHGAGNDFVIVDNRSCQKLMLNSEQIKFICNRYTGVGADGLMLLSNSDVADFRMTYYNSDGKEGSMCGNGGRCIVEHARQVNIISKNAFFIATDGFHEAVIISSGIVKLKLIDVNGIEKKGNDFVLNTGSPHYVSFVENVSLINTVEAGKHIRYSNDFRVKGINVNFVSIENEKLYVSTYERGVENETLSCGTGVTASAIAFSLNKPDGKYNIPVITKGGNLEVSFTKIGNTFTDVWLEGPAVKVFEGEIKI